MRVQYSTAFDVQGESVIFSGKIGRVSPLPDPQKAPYEDCLFSAEFFPVEKDYTKTILLFPGFKNRVIFPESEHIKKDISIKAYVLPFDELPDEVQIIQQADELNDIDSEVFYVKFFELTDDIKVSYQRINRATVTIVPPKTDINANNARSKRIEAERKRIQSIIEDNGGFDEWRQKGIYSVLKEQKEINNVLFSWSGDSILKGFASKYPQYSAVEGLTALNLFLQSHGIHLIVLVWPSPEEVSADLFFPEDIKKEQYLDIKRVQLMQDLLTHDVEVIDLLPPLKEHRFAYPPLLFQAHLYDSHPASGAARVAGETIAQILKRYSDAEPETNDLFSLIEIKMRNGRQYEDHTETAVSLNGKQYSFSDDSDILFAGDSFAYHPQIASSVGAFFSYYSKKRTALHSRSGGAQRLFRTLLQAQQQTKLLDSKKAVVLSVIPSHLFLKWEIPIGYPDFKDETFEIRKYLSPENNFGDASAQWSASETPIDFSTGKIPSDIQIPPRGKVMLCLPDFEGINEGILSIVTRSPEYFELRFSENGNGWSLYTGGGLWNNNEEEILIPFQTGKEMKLLFSPNVSIVEIKYMKRL